MIKKMKTLFFTILILLVTTSCYCCVCIGKATVSQELKRSDVVFTGKVLSSKVLELRDSIMPDIKIHRAEYVIQVTKIYKGRLKAKTLTVVTGLGGGDCGFEFEVGNNYIIYSSYKNRYYPQGSKVNRFLYTNICRRTRLVVDEEEIKALRKKCNKLLGVLSFL